MNSLPEIKLLSTYLLRPTSVCSQFVKLDGQCGWLAAPLDPCKDGYEFHGVFGIKILLWFDDLFANLEEATVSDLKEFYAHRRNVDTELTACYSRSTYTGD